MIAVGAAVLLLKPVWYQHLMKGEDGGLNMP